MATSDGKDEAAITEFISQPCGPRKLAKTLNSCIIQHTKYPRQFEPVISQQIPKATAPSPKVVQPIVHESTDIGEDPPTLSLRLEENGHSNGTSPNRVASNSEQQTAPDGLNVLIVDDNNINLQLLVAYIKKQKYPYKTAVNGLEALEAVKAEPWRFKAILMDITMLVMDGLTATREIRHAEQEFCAGLEASAKEAWKPATVVAVTGLGSASHQQETMNSGIDNFLSKPIRFQELKEILESCK